VPNDGEAVGEPEPFGAFELYLTLGSRIAAQDALDAADAVTGGTATTFRRNDKICYRASLALRANSSRSFVTEMLRTWAQGRSHLSVQSKGKVVGFTACDPGRKATGPDLQRFQDMVELLSVRTALTVEFRQTAPTSEQSRCLARVFMHHDFALPFFRTIGSSEPTPAQQQQLFEAGANSRSRCDADVNAELR
jgi:hypothetical protein